MVSKTVSGGRTNSWIAPCLVESTLLMAFGHLTGKYLNGGKPKGLCQALFLPFGQRYDKPNVEPASAAYVDLAKRYRLSPTSLAFAFVRSRWFVASTIIGVTSLEQL